MIFPAPPLRPADTSLCLKPPETTRTSHNKPSKHPFHQETPYQYRMNKSTNVSDSVPSLHCLPDTTASRNPLQAAADALFLSTPEVTSKENDSYSNEQHTIHKKLLFQIFLSKIILFHSQQNKIKNKKKRSTLQITYCVKKIINQCNQRPTVI